MFKKYLMVMMIVLMPFAAEAQWSYELDDLKDGEVLINLSASESVEVEQDTLIATLRYEAKNKDRVALQNEINTVIKKALEKIKKEDTVDVTTQRYNVYERYEDRRLKTNKTWHGQQSLQLKSKDSETLLDLVAELQGLSLTMNNLYYTLSPQKQAEVKDGMLEDVLKSLQARADVARKVLGKSRVDMVRVDLGGSQNYQKPHARSLAFAKTESISSADAVQAPNAEPGKTTVSISVSASALLKP